MVGGSTHKHQPYIFLRKVGVNDDGVWSLNTKKSYNDYMNQSMLLHGDKLNYSILFK